MKTDSSPLPCVLINCGTHRELHDEDLSSLQYRGLQHLLAPCGGVVMLGTPALPVEVRWVEEKTGWPPQFEIYRGDDPLLVAGLATDNREATRLRGWFNLLQGTTFRCLRRPETDFPRSLPWLGILLMPGALALCDAHLDELCGLGQTVAQVWFRQRLVQPATAL